MKTGDNDVRMKEAEAKYNAIKDKLEKEKSKKPKVIICFLIFSIVYISFIFGSNLFIPKNESGEILEQYRGISIIFHLIMFAFFIIFLVRYSEREWGNTTEQLFYYLYAAYENRHSENVKSLLTSAIRKIEDIMDEYKDLPFSEKIVNELTMLHYAFLCRVYPHLYTQKPTDNEKSEGWKSVRDIAIDIIDNSLTEEKISDFDSKLAELNFERKVSVKLEDEKESLISQYKRFFVDKYNSSWIWRLSTWAVIAAIISLILNTIWGIAPESLVPIVVGIPVAASSIKEIK